MTTVFQYDWEERVKARIAELVALLNADNDLFEIIGVAVAVPDQGEAAFLCTIDTEDGDLKTADMLRDILGDVDAEYTTALLACFGPVDKSTMH